MPQTMKHNKTGWVTFRRTVDGDYVIIAWYEDWNKAHAINPAYPMPNSKPARYKAIGLCFEAVKKSMVNCLIRKHLPVDLATGDYHFHPDQLSDVQVKGEE